MKCYDRKFDEFRCIAYVKKDLRSRKSAVNLTSLPPKKDAEAQHISRIFQQIQKRLGLKQYKILKTPSINLFIALDCSVNLIYIKILRCKCTGGA